MIDCTRTRLLISTGVRNNEGGSANVGPKGVACSPSSVFSPFANLLAILSWNIHSGARISCILFGKSLASELVVPTLLLRP